MIDVPVEVKDALREGTYKKNYRFVVLNDDGTEDFTIDNDTLVSESVNIDERMCSGDTLKFGLCEGSSLEFQYFDHPNITGRRVQVFVDVEYEKVITEYVWETQARFNNYYTISDMSGDCRLYSERSNAWEFVYVSENGETTQVTPTPSESGTIIELGDVTGRTLMVNLDVMPAPSAQLQLLIPHTGPQILTYSIPMGFFDVKKCSRQASTGIMKATAYNKLMSDYLDAKAAEQIDALLEAGEDGMNDVSLYDILRQLLEGYSINEYDQSVTVSRTSVTVHDENSFLVNYNRKDFPSQSHTGRLKIKYDSITFTIPSSLVSPGMYYNAKIKYSFAETIQSAFNRMISGIDESDYDFYTTVNYLDASSQTINSVTYTLQDIFNNAVKASENTNIKSDLYTMKGGALFRVVNFGPVLERYNDLNELRGDLTTRAHCYDNTRVQLTFPTKIYIVDNIVDELANTLVSVDISITPDDVIDLNILELSDFQKMRFSVAQEDLFSDVTLRELQTAVFETQCQFGQLDRVTDLFSGVEINHSRLYPADTLYPSDSLYPAGAALSGFKSMYSKLWADEGNVHKWRYLIITYKGLNGDNQEEDFTLQRTVNADGTDDYNMSDNWLFRNLIWTAEQVGEYADAMVAKMQDVMWFPFEMWCAGLPYLETGDEIEIPLNGESYTSYVLQRQLKGIQNLQDTYINGTLDIF